MEQLLGEAFRLRLMRGLEGWLGQAGYTRVAGVDEAGRGCLAGPVVAAAVIVDPRVSIPGIDDSKRLSAAARERLADAIRRGAVAWAVAHVSPRTIDRINILEATRRAMRQALTSLDPAPDCAVVDAVTLPPSGFPCLPLVRGDSLSYAVACASILAKVDRDRMMQELHRRYPQYGFDAHKGYGARQHREALRAFGPTPVHRLTFRSVLPRAGEGVH
jgi:ribonuclease HII